MGERGKPKWKLIGKQARRLFVEKGKGIREISELLDVSERSLYLWRQDDNWEQRREVYESSIEKAVGSIKTKILDLACQLDNTAATEAAGLADTLSKLDKVLDRFEARRDPRTETMNVMDGFIEWMTGRRDDEGLKLLGARFRAYAQHVIRSTA